jgi:hypothetical protein
MRDLLSKLDKILIESALNPKDPKGDYEAKKQALDDLEADPVAGKDPEISQAITQRRADLEKEAKSSGIEETEEDLYQIGDDFGISFSEDLEISTEIVDLAEDGIIVDLDEEAIDYLTQQGFTFEDTQIAEEKQKGVDGKACWKGYKRMGTKQKGGKTVDNCVKVSESLDEAKSYGTLPSDVLRKLYGAYQETSDGVEQHQDQEGAKRIYDALKAVAVENGAQSELRSLMNAASHSAHMDFDTNPGDFKNWFTYVGDLLQALIRIHDEKEQEPDTELDDSINTEAKYQGREVPLGKKMAGDVKKSKVYVRKPNGNIVKVNFGDKKMRIKKSNPARRKSFRARHNCKNPGPRWKARYWSCRSW